MEKLEILFYFVFVLLGLFAGSALLELFFSPPKIRKSRKTVIASEDYVYGHSPSPQLSIEYFLEYSNSYHEASIIKRKIIDNINPEDKKYLLKVDVENLAEAIKSAFVWEASNEGHEYWEKIYNSLAETGEVKVPYNKKEGLHVLN